MVMTIFGIILIAVVFGVVFKVLITEAKPYKKPLKKENAVNEKAIPKIPKEAKEQKANSVANQKKTNDTRKTNIRLGGYGYLLNGAGAIGGRMATSRGDSSDDAQYRAYREELAAYDDFVVSLDDF